MTSTLTAGGDLATASARLRDRLASGPPVSFGSHSLRDLIAHIGAGVLDRDREGRPPVAEFELIRAARLGALRLPVDHGGGGATVAELFATVVDLAAAQASLQAAKAKIVLDELALPATSSLYDVAGGSAVRRVTQLDRHWRNIRTLASHNPRTHKARWVGNHEINGEPVPTGAFF